MSTTTDSHTVTAFDDELRALGNMISEMGGRAEKQLDEAIQAVVRRDPDLAARAIESDREIDALEQEINAQAVRMLALRQPMAVDLREIVSALKIAGDIERIGDHAANVAKRATPLADAPRIGTVHSIAQMTQLVRGIISETLGAYVSRDVDKALVAWKRDEEVDEIYTSLFRELLTYMMEDPRNITPCTHLLFIAKNVERIGDHATNIAETLHYQVTGEALSEDRPKGDRTSFTKVAPAEGSGD